MDWGGANSRFLGLVSVWAARSFDQTALRPSVIKRIRQIDVKIHNNNNNNICLKSNIQTSSVDCAPRELTHITSFCVTA